MTTNGPEVLLTGASSQIGVFAIPRLLNAGFRVLAVSRKARPEYYSGLEQLSWLTQGDAKGSCGNCNFMFSAGPMELALDFMDLCTQLQAVVVFSSSSVISKQFSADPSEHSQIQQMRTQESALRSNAQARGLKLQILRPTLIYGCGLDANISRLANWIRRYGFAPVNGRARGLRQPVHADDLASLAINALQSDKPLPVTMSLAGGSTLSYTDMVTELFSVDEKPVRLLRLPQWLFVLIVRILRFTAAGAGLNPEMVIRQNVDLVFDDSQARELLDYRPRKFKPKIIDFSIPGDSITP